jgi:hypothetical protein
MTDPARPRHTLASLMATPTPRRPAFAPLDARPEPSISITSLRRIIEASSGDHEAAVLMIEDLIDVLEETINGG